jgi:diadenosine tetraphosphatase ApaH/serine/threonine PP2A family protein phosphatase
MKILIISDIHANLTALETVLAEAGSIDATWCLGDLVGYGPDPEQCVSMIRQLPNLVCVIGNHDAALLNLIDTAAFNPEARQALHWTMDKLSTDSLDFMRSLSSRQDLELVTLAHASPRQPIWEYLLDTRTATANFAYFDTPYCLVGHTHLPVLYYLPDESQMASLVIPENNTQLTLAPRSIVNPGSVGQPRDRDRRAAYGILDTEEYVFHFRRVEYDIAAVQDRMRAANLPARHIMRLEVGW